MKIIEGDFCENLGPGDRAGESEPTGDDEANDKGVDRAGNSPSDGLNQRTTMPFKTPEPFHVAPPFRGYLMAEKTTVVTLRRKREELKLRSRIEATFLPVTPWAALAERNTRLKISVFRFAKTLLACPL
jgi:hypothetical protein